MAEKKKKKPKAKEKVEKKPKEEVKETPEEPKTNVSEKLAEKPEVKKEPEPKVEDKVEKEAKPEEKPEEPTPVEKPVPAKKAQLEELVEKVYDIVEISRSTGKVKRGTNEVTKSVERSEPQLVIIADDCDPPEILMHLPGLSEERGIPLVKVPSKKELGSVSGLDVPCVAIAVIDGGEAKDILIQVRRQLKGTKE